MPKWLGFLGRITRKSRTEASPVANAQTQPHSEPTSGLPGPHTSGPLSPEADGKRGENRPTARPLAAGVAAIRKDKNYGITVNYEGSERTPGSAAAVGPRRRRATRYDYQVKVTARCESWPQFIDLYTRDMSAGGMFCPTTAPARVGERIHVTIELPERIKLELTGTVANVLDEVRASRFGRNPGVGVMLDVLDAHTAEQFERLLVSARAATPTPRRADTAGAGSPLKPAAAESVSRGAGRTSNPVIGIDFGTSRIAVAVARGPHVTVIRRPDGARACPSVIAAIASGDVFVGHEAFRYMAEHPDRAVSSPKRLLGRDLGDPALRPYLESLPQRCQMTSEGDIALEIGATAFDVPELCAHLFDDARRAASAHLGCDVTDAVIAVPIGYDRRQVSAIERAAFLAGLRVVAVIDEPSAAALANWSDPHFGGVVGIYDFGGGTFEFSLLDVSAGDFRVLASAGDPWLGGDDFDAVLAELAAEAFRRRHAVDLRRQPVEWQRLLVASEQARCALSRERSVELSVPNVLRGPEGMLPLKTRVDRDMFAAVSGHLIERSLAVCKETVRLADIELSELQAVYMSGGVTHMPTVREAVADLFGVPLRTVTPPEYAVCLGAAVHAAQRGSERAPVLNERWLRRRTPTCDPHQAAV